jgi:hypothetical protein
MLLCSYNKFVGANEISQIGDIVDCVRDDIKYLIASEGRLKQFCEIAKQLQLSSKKLILEVPTR